MAVLFVVGAFFLKKQSEYKNDVGNKVGLAYGEVIVGDLIGQDSDHDGIADWEETLWGTDPNLKDTDGDGVNDDVAITKLKAQNTSGVTITGPEDEILTETDKFSRELFSTVATLNQAGPIDQDTVDKLSATLSDKLQTPVIRKVFLASEIKVSATDDKAATQKYNTDLGKLASAYPMNGHVLDILQEFLDSGETPDITILLKLDPITSQINKSLTAMSKMEVPKSLVPLHINLMNTLEQTTENLTDLQLFDSDSIVAMSAMSQFNKNSELLQGALQKLSAAIAQKLNS